MLVWTGRILFALLVAALFAPFVVPPFLDRIYYRGPKSDHFDGERFFNPGASPQRPPAGRGAWARFMTGRDRAPWPARVPVTPAVPEPRLLDVACGAPMRVTWIGHATALVQVAGLNILTDPLWSDRASPVRFAGPRRVRAPGVRFDDLPRIDVVLISHNHYDHLDLPTLRRLWRRDRPLIVTSLGNDTILRAAGIPSVAGDWGSRIPLERAADANCAAAPVEVIVDRVHHWGSRYGKDRNRALWSGFTVVLPGGNLFFAGDTGLGDGRWPAEAARHGPVRLALLPIGAFRPRDLMQDSHMDPAEAVTAFERLGAAHALGIHWGTFQLTDEGIDEPRQGLAAALAARGIAADRFRTSEVGEGWDVPPLQPPANSPSAATSSSLSEMPNRADSAAR